LFDFEIRHISGIKHTAVNGLLKKPKLKSDDEDEKLETDIDNYINAEFNSIRIFFITIADDEFILDGDYFKRLIFITKYLSDL
jgi:hypothetical protein